MCGGQAFAGEAHPGGLIAFASIRMRGQIRSVGFDQQSIKRHCGGDFNNLTGFINDPRIWGAQFKANF